ncbi:MAG: TPM domain-containing protein [Betaproteobacteria bacterium]
MNWNRFLRHVTTPHWRVGRAFPAAVLSRIEQAIARSESLHGGQIRFAVEHALDAAALWRGVGARERALQVFSMLNVWDTEHNNGVLIYLLLADRDVEIVADRGIHVRAGAPAWEAICRWMEGELRAGRFEEAVCGGIERVSTLLEAHFPRGAQAANELPDRPVIL